MQPPPPFYGFVKYIQSGSIFPISWLSFWKHVSLPYKVFLDDVRDVVKSEWPFSQWTEGMCMFKWGRGTDPILKQIRVSFRSCWSSLILESFFHWVCCISSWANPLQSPALLHDDDWKVPVAHKRLLSMRCSLVIEKC